LAGGPLLAASVLLHGRLLAGTVNWPLLVALALGLGITFMLIGWLFASVQYVEAVQDGNRLPAPRPRWLLLIILAALGALLLFAASWLTPVTTEISAPSLGNTDIDSVANALRARGAVIGISSQPVEQPAFAVPGTVLLVDEAELWLFVYEDVAAATADAAAIYRGEQPFAGTDLIQQGNLLLAFPQADAQMRALLHDLFGPPVRNPEDSATITE